MLGRLLEYTADTSLSSPAQWLVDALTGGTSSAGVSVTENKAMGLPAVFRAVGNIASHLAMMPALVCRKIDAATTERLPLHPVHELLNREANEHTTAVAFRQALQVHALLWGTGRAEIQRDNAGRPIALELMLPDKTFSKRDGDRIYHEVYDEEGRKKGEVEDADCLRIPSLSYNGLVGYSLISFLAKENMGLSLAIARYAQAFFGNFTQMGVVLSAPNVLKKETREANVAAWNEAHQGPDKAFKAVLMDGGISVNKMGMQHDQAQLIELMTFSVQDVARWLNVPPPLLMDLSHATFSNITELGQWYVKYSLGPWLPVLDQEFGRKLFSRSERQAGFYVEHIAEGLLRGDVKARSEFYRTMAERGFTVNQILKLENMNGIGPIGDLHLVPANMTPLEQMAQNLERGEAADYEARMDDNATDGNNAGATLFDVTEVRKQIAEAHGQLFAEVFSRMSKVEGTAVRRAVKREELTKEWADSYYAEFGLKLRSALTPYMESLSHAMRPTFGPMAHTLEWDTMVLAFKKENCDENIQTSGVMMESGPLSEDGVKARIDDSRNIPARFMQLAVNFAGEADHAATDTEKEGALSRVDCPLHGRPRIFRHDRPRPT